MSNQIMKKLLKDTESRMDHFLSTLSEQVINNKAALFLGTGVSMNSGLPSWKVMLAPCAEDLNLSLDTETDLYAVAQFYVNKHNDATLRREISNSINKKYETNNLLENLTDIRFSSIWTTNYDTLIEDSLKAKNIEYNAVFKDEDLVNINTYQRVSIYKMNGDISNPSDMIVTKNDYEHYQSKHPLFLTYLKKDLVARTFLFVGYSFTDDLVISTLNSIKCFLGNSTNMHYAIMMIDESNATARLEYFVEDLKSRYNVECIFSTKENIPNIIAKLNAKIVEKNIFISGSYYDVSNEISDFADNLSKKMVEQLFDKGYRISSGIGKKLGTFIAGYAYQYLADKNNPNKEKFLSMKPFPFHLALSDDQKKKYRKIMQQDCSASIFLFGQSKINEACGIPNKSKHDSPGVYMEFTIAKELGHTIIPIGSTGYEAKIIWDEVKKNINDYPYLTKRIESLEKEKDPTKIMQIVCVILDEVAENR